MNVDVVFDQWQDVMDSASVTMADYAFGGTMTRVYVVDSSLIQAVDEVVGGCRVGLSQAQADISFFLISEDEAPDLVRFVRDWAGLVDEANPVSQSSVFTLWSDSSCRRRLDVHTDKARAWCDLKQRRAAALISKGDINTPWLVGHYVFFPLWVQMLKSAGLFQIHAACLSDGDKSLLLPGPSGSGKSTLSINLVRNGFKFLNDDTVFLQDVCGSVVAQSFIEDIKICEGTIDLFPELGFLREHDASRMRPKHHFAIEDVFAGSGHDMRAVPQTIVFPRFTGKAETKVKPVTSAGALANLLRFSIFMIDPHSRAEQFQVLTQLVEQAQCYEAEIGTDNDRSAHAIRMLLEEGSNGKELASA